ncbi:gamma-tubulin ring complex protein [Coniophora puteana RWD-64-598 SS2]|uniref:Spindle pole body component n=1 Tax=Coniophora puteana (strain RWD-64-598) TaxID=741705 RepID=A0A5M3N6V1_CONPW|nr:gamma-tubulin ring complex protein [Coniophora puteana RWD-64-598 SS2]EIW87008.1 gamma-tubulin ring complex protein [Coniophora puteana RWD-64-598 SS2]
MIAEVLLVLAGHESSLFPDDHRLHPSFRSLLHPGEEQCLEALGQIASRYRQIKASCAILSRSSSRYICALCATLSQILKDEYESLVVETEAKVLKRDPSLVGQGSFVPLSAIRATFAQWDAPLIALQSLMRHLESQDQWRPGPLIDMLLERSKTGVYRIHDVISRLAIAVQRIWRSQLASLLIHGALSSTDPLASKDYILVDGSLPTCISEESKESIIYVGRAIATVKVNKWQKQLPRDLALQHASLLESVWPEDQYKFDSVLSQIRTNVSEWLWQHVLTQKDVEDAVESLANYFLLRNGEFSLALIREIERLKISRLAARTAGSSLIREQDLNLAVLRASLGTTAQHDSALLLLHFQLPSGPLRPLLPSLSSDPQALSSSTTNNQAEMVTFDDLVLGTPLILSYAISWPLDLFLYAVDLQIYSALFNYLSSLRRTHIRIHGCWTSLSNAQRARRRWTGLGEGGTAEDLNRRKELLRCGWSVVRDMGWFLDTLLGYVMIDVVDVEHRRLKDLLRKPYAGSESIRNRQRSGSSHPYSDEKATTSPSYLDFTTLRNIHTTYLERLVTGCLLSNPALTAIIRPIFQVCDRFVAQVERWGGDILPALLFEGSLGSGDDVGTMVRERFETVTEINKVFHTLLNSFYEQLSISTSNQPFNATADASKSILANSTLASVSTFQRTYVRTKGAKGLEGDGEVRRHVERLLLRLDFNGAFSKGGGSRFKGGNGVLPGEF